MSTLTSVDLHVKRSSTRLHAPPGGVSSLSFGCGGLGAAEPRVESDKVERAYAPSSISCQHAPPTNIYNYNNNKPDDHSSYSAFQPEPTQPNNYASPQQLYHQQSCHPQRYQSQSPYIDSYDNNIRSQSSNGNRDEFHGACPPSTTPSSRSGLRASLSLGSWGSQPPLTSSKRDQNWEKKRRLWLVRRSSDNKGNRPMSSFSANNNQCGESHDNSINPTSPLSKLLHQHAQLQQQPPPTTHADNQRLDTASSTRSSPSTTYRDYQSYPHESKSRLTQESGVGYPAGGATFSRAGLSTASSSAFSTTSRRQPPGGHCQWSLG